MGILCLPCNVVCRGTFSGAFAWAMNATEIAQNVANTTAPLFKHAFAYGAINGAVGTIVGAASTVIKDRVVPADNVMMDITWEFTTEVLLILSRYGTAFLCNQAMGSKIPYNYVHIGTAIRLGYESLAATATALTGNTPRQAFRNMERFGINLDELMRGLEGMDEGDF